MATGAAKLPDFELARGIVPEKVVRAAVVASRALRDAGIPHALAGGLAVCAHGYPRNTDDVDFLVGEEAYIRHAGGLITLKVPLIAVETVRVDLVSIGQVPESELRQAVEHPLMSEEMPIVPLPVLVHMKLLANRLKDLADLAELLKRGRIPISTIDAYLRQHAPDQVSEWESLKARVAREE